MPSSPVRVPGRPASGASRRWIAFAALALVLALAWLFARAWGAGEIAAASAGAPTPEGERAPGEDLAAAAGAPRAESTRVADRTAAAEHAETAEVVAVTDEGPRIELRALRAGSIEPMPGVEILWACDPDAASAQARFYSWFVDGELDARLASIGRSVVADERGRAEIPRPDSGLVVVARAPGWWGMTSTSSDPDPVVEVTLERERELAVQVVDGLGRPVGDVPVALRSSLWGNAQDRLRARSSPEDGIARLRHVESALGVGGAQEWSVALAIASVKPISASVEPLAPSRGPIRLVLPETGACAVRLVDESGGLVKQPFDVLLGAALAGGAERERRRPDRDGATLLDVADGVALFPFVELGTELFASARRPGNWVTHGARGLGPKRAGETVQLEVRIGSEVSTLSGRVVDSAGQPLARREVQLELGISADREREQQLGSTRTDADGAFRLDVSPRTSSQQSYALIVELRDPATGDYARGSRPLPTPMPKGLIDVGDVVLETLPVLLAGTVLGEDDAPIARAQVTAHTYVPEDGWNDFDGETYWWANTRSDEQGRFELRGKTSFGELQIGAAAGERRSAPARVRAGDAQIVLRVGATGTIVGRVLKSEDAAAQAFVISARSSDAEHRGDDTTGEIAGDGSFVLRRLLPGEYDVALRDQTRWNELLTVPGVLVRAGETTRDPRLDPIDLRTSLFVVRLTIVDERGEPVQRGWFVRELVDASGETGQEYGPISNGKAVVTHDGTGANVRLHVEGFCALRLERLMSDRTVTLRRAPTIRLAIEPAPTLEAGAKLYASVAPENGDGNDGAWLELDANGQAEQRVPATGTLVVTFYVMVGGEENGRWESVADAQPRLKVEDVPGVQLFEVALDGTKLAEAIARAQAPPAEDE